MYFVSPADTSVLYGSTHAVAPLPQGLYREELLPFNNGILGFPQARKKWTPTVHLMDAKLYRAHLGEALDEKSRPSRDEKVSLHRLKTYSISDSSGYSPQVGELVRNNVVRHVVPAIKRHLTTAGRLGIISPNDCARFAFVLKNLILSEHGVGGSVHALLDRPVAAALNNPSRRIGDMVLLGYQDGGRHGITVVAERGPPYYQVVTLEAHASRPLAKPEFHIYRGRTMRPMLEAWFPADQRIHPRSTVRYIPTQLAPGMLDRSVTVEGMAEASASLQSLLGAWFSYDDRMIYRLLASAGSVPVLFRGAS